MLVEEEVEKGKLRQIIECPTLENGKCSCLVLCFSLCKLKFTESHLHQHLFSYMDKPLTYYRSSTPHTLLLASRHGAGEGMPRRMLPWLPGFQVRGLHSTTVPSWGGESPSSSLGGLLEAGPDLGPLQREPFQ